MTETDGMSSLFLKELQSANAQGLAKLTGGAIFVASR
jgi:hypothetical protein